MVAVGHAHHFWRRNPIRQLFFSVGGGSFLPMVNALAHGGYHVIYANTRFRGNDTALLMEKCARDLGAVIAHAKEKFGYKKLFWALVGRRSPSLSIATGNRHAAETHRRR